jgi:hypothetical protein
MKKMSLLSMLILCFFSKAQTDDNEIKNVAKKRALAECEIVVSPNPSQGTIFVNAPDGSTVILTSSKGTYIGSWEVHSGGFKLEGMSTGTYVAIINDDNSVVTRRFIVL